MLRLCKDACLLRSLIGYYLVVCLLLPNLLLTSVHGLSAAHIANLKEETEDLFYHGYENYMKHAFPEDELRPVSCTPLTRDPSDPAHIEVNDALGNYSLTLIDSLSTLAILASSPSHHSDENKALRLFQDGVKDLVTQYGDGTEGPNGFGRRARGFDLDSKVQVFETVIRGLGGLLSAHLFATGDLPIRGYSPTTEQAGYARQWHGQSLQGTGRGIKWNNDFLYDGQLLRLAYDLGKRMLPAFWTPTGMPYPRVNLRDGIPFYANSPLNRNPLDSQCDSQQGRSEEVTETCSAGAGSLVLEFTVLSRLTGDARFEELAKRAFWSVWSRRSDINLIGAGIDAETGLWTQPYTGIGAGIDSFFEYAFKSFVLLSSDFHPPYEEIKYDGETRHNQDPRELFGPLSAHEHTSSSFLEAWEAAHTANKRHLLRGSNYQHPHYIQGDLTTGAARAFWIDALSAFYPGLLTISGYVEEAIEAHLLTTALWTRFSALPERWNLVTGGIEGGLGWWVGRPEFIESNYYLYRATDDPWYQYVAEMTLEDIKRRCWAECGWSGIQDVLTGEKSDRMESFFLGETAKYLFLTFDEDHPFNRLDRPFVFSTEGHPLIIPPTVGNHQAPWSSTTKPLAMNGTCPAKMPHLPFSISVTAARGDIYHAASLARLDLTIIKSTVAPDGTEYGSEHIEVTTEGVSSHQNYTYYPWTLPPEMIPYDAMSTTLPTRPTFDISFPNLPASGHSLPPLQRVKDGILINSLGGLRLGLVQDVPVWLENDLHDGYRVHAINNVGLGIDEKVYLARDTGMHVLDPADPDFSHIRDAGFVDIVIEAGSVRSYVDDSGENSSNLTIDSSLAPDGQGHGTIKAAWHSLMSQITSLIQDPQQLGFAFNTQAPPAGSDAKVGRFAIPAIIPIGIGAAPLPDWTEAPSQVTADSMEKPLGWRTVYAADELCNHKLPASVPKLHQVIIVKRGNCSFSQKLSNIPTFTPSPTSLQLVVIVNFKVEADGSAEDLYFQPLLDRVQMTSTGLHRQNPVAMVMVAGGAETYEALQRARGIGIKRRYSIRSQGIPITNLLVV